MVVVEGVIILGVEALDLMASEVFFQLEKSPDGTSFGVFGFFAWRLYNGRFRRENRK
jgi:hypothetical protein